MLQGVHGTSIFLAYVCHAVMDSGFGSNSLAAYLPIVESCLLEADVPRTNATCAWNVTYGDVDCKRLHEPSYWSELGLDTCAEGYGIEETFDEWAREAKGWSWGMRMLGWMFDPEGYCGLGP